jgi:hypothetical protein
MFTKETKARLIAALTRKSLADEFEAKAATPGTISKKLKDAILAMMGNKKAAAEVVAALETAGNQELTGPKHQNNAITRLQAALTRKKAASEIDDQI